MIYSVVLMSHLFFEYSKVIWKLKRFNSSSTEKIFKCNYEITTKLNSF